MHAPRFGAPSIVATFALAGCCVVGCGGSVSSAAFDDPTDAASESTLNDSISASDGASVDVGADAVVDVFADTIPTPDATLDVVTPDVGADLGAPDTGGPVALTDVCEKIATAVCTDAEKSCCTNAGYGFNEDDCRAAMHVGCDALVADVNGGTRTYDPSKVATCIDAWRTLTASCSESLLSFIKDYAPCENIFPGGASVGDDCSADSDCAPQPGAAATCSTSSSTCVITFVVGSGKPCDYTGDTNHVCDLGLTCAAGSAGAYTCIPATPEGDSCPGGSSDLSCGYGFVCGDDGNCDPGAVQGASCDQNLDCASWSCTDNQCDADSFSTAIAGLCEVPGSSSGSGP